jgi:catechol 2,3-dioxygenase-like lactoylglutathione lyase family enzyme
MPLTAVVPLLSAVIWLTPGVRPVIPCGRRRMPRAARTLVPVLHHLTLWVPDLARAAESWSWLLNELGYALDTSVDRVMVFRDERGIAIVLEQSADMVPGMLHSRMRPGLNHVAFSLPTKVELVALVAGARDHGWSPLPGDRHPIAGGAEVAYLEDRDGFEVELVAPRV